MPLGQLTHVLREVIDTADSRLLIGPQSVDDAGIVLLGPEEGMAEGSRTALVQTVDYFPPIVDDPYLYGAIAAANALSDVYAMGGRPFSVLNLAGFPKGFPDEWIQKIFRGGFEKVKEAGAVIAGGHTVESEEPHFGFAVTGLVDRDRVLSNAGARAGDRLYLTKSLGMGALTTAAKAGKLDEAIMASAGRQMAALNDRACAAMNAVGASACTDITGFGLIGHARNVAVASKVTMRFRLAQVPLFDGALAAAHKGLFSGGAARGRATLAEEVRVDAACDETLAQLCFDAETSGGLLISLPAERAAQLEHELEAREVPVHPVGEVVESTGFSVELA